MSHSTSRLPRPIVLLLLVLAALLAPATPGSATTTTTVAVRQVVASHTAPVTGQADHRPDHATLSGATAHAPAPVHSTAAADRRPPAPRLLLVQRPRPPTHGSTH